MDMPIIPDKDRDSLKRELRKDLKNDVTIKLFSQGSSLLTIPGRECRYCPQTQQLMEELTSLSPKLHLEVVDVYSQAEERQKYGIEQIPAIVLGDNSDGRLKFYGLPAGLEFPTIVAGIKTISRGVSPLSMDSRRKLKKVSKPVHIRVFVTPSCGYCPGVARIAHAIALENSNVTADVIEVEEFPAMAQTYQVRGVPKTVITQESKLGVLPKAQLVGAVSEEEFVDNVVEAGADDDEAV